jgi:hypothetical protein
MQFRIARAGAMAFALALSLGTTGCVVREQSTEIIAPRPPPVARVEIVPAPPRPLEVVEWQPGHWHWDGREYVWVTGRYIERPRREAVYVPGHWDERPNGRWVWIAPHWR